MYGSIVRPDLAFVVKELVRKQVAPTVADWQKARRLMRYLNGTTYMLLQLTGHEDADGGLGHTGIDVYADANWAAGPSRRSTSGGCVFFKGTVIVTWARTQPTATLSI
eukprot:7930037-Heterocapsa_arctica.AAC.1